MAKENFCRILLIIIMYIPVVSCKSKTQDKNISIAQANASEQKFRHWLRDTLSILNTQPPGHSNLQLKVAQDSLFLEISKQYEMEIDRNYSGNERELIYALDLLRRNNALPQKPFHVELTVAMYYTNAMVEQLPYDFNSEIKRLNVVFNDSTFAYNFVKGNLIDKKAKANK